MPDGGRHGSNLQHGAELQSGEENSSLAGGQRVPVLVCQRRVSHHTAEGRRGSCAGREEAKEVECTGTAVSRPAHGLWICHQHGLPKNPRRGGGRQCAGAVGLYGDRVVAPTDKGPFISRDFKVSNSTFPGEPAGGNRGKKNQTGGVTFRRNSGSPPPPLRASPFMPLGVQAPRRLAEKSGRAVCPDLHDRVRDAAGLLLH